ncbi:hypothetical protein GII30_19475 [Gordonia amarae]|uniref:Peptide deformylase n=2 Tax=Gordonia amarae TaxID=36821 RepID=G7GKJ6_9ACTN|nr:peptide deformylase [Gordonia amarae]MCS3880620.1 peptide deformylase [Gordonia amarae]QHN18927.1 hypothetical protein GII35_19830 [Gordonia amarae]QHN23402.1 hypothetical protein GII34_19330 [Gordonia amarae]QHN32303.1 hypothetical protein GII32_19645 [Gordonia amarae]QHN41051.1 hypothetical protein GII30_19475 [Gordonia amarae]
MPLKDLLVLGNPVTITRRGDPVLHWPCRPATTFGPELWNLLCTMFATNRAADGAGLAALSREWKPIDHG